MQEKKQSHTLEDFIKLVRKAVLLSHQEEAYFNQIPLQQWEKIFKKNFNANLSYAERVLLNRFADIERIDTPEVDLQKKKIFNLSKATNTVIDAIEKKMPIFFVTDIDNDGSLSQAVIMEYLKVDKSAARNMRLEYAQVVNGNANRGFTVDLIDKLSQVYGFSSQEPVLVITADNGINSREEQKKIQAHYPNLTLLVTDHHNPEPDMVIEEGPRAIIFNPHYKPTEFFKKYNISGAATIGVLLNEVLGRRYTQKQLQPFKQNLRNMRKISKVSNVLDYVDSHPADKPEKDYVVSRFVELQPLMNINNSISKMITGEIDEGALEAIREKIPQLDIDALKAQVKNIQTQNSVARILLKIYAQNKNNLELKEQDFDYIFLQQLNTVENYEQEWTVDDNYIGQLRPAIFNLTADDEKTPFLDALNSKMIQVFESVKEAEKSMAAQLRAGEVVTKSKKAYSTIAYADPNILTIFNRKFLNKVYNDENPGFSLTLDSIGRDKVSGSFRSLYDISDIMRKKKRLEKELGVKIETPGHERAAGFIVKSTNPGKNPITSKTIDAINEHIDAAIQAIKAKEVASNEQFIVTDLENIHIIDKINKVVRGNVAQFERITPVVKIHSDTIWTDAYTTEQFTMEEVVKSRKYGYITINTNFHGGTVIIPVEVVRRIVEGNYQDYLSLNYMDEGVFMVERVVEAKHINNVVDLRTKNSKSEVIDKVFSTDFKDTNIIELTRAQLMDNPFFKYNDYGDLNFELFEKMVIGVIDSNKVEMLTVFDVEANGFGNARIMNFGATNYTIDEKSGERLDADSFYSRFFYSQRGEQYLLTAEQLHDLIEVSEQELSSMDLEQRQQALTLFDHSGDQEFKTYIYPRDKQKKVRNKLRLPFEQVANFIESDDGVITYNRRIKASMIAYIVKDKDFRAGQEIENLTGISQAILNKHGKLTHEVDAQLTQFYQDKNVIFGAHNTPYDAKILRANLPRMYEKLKNSALYDSALFSKNLRLAYDYIEGVSFENLSGIPENIFFYHNELSDFNLKKLLVSGEDGYYPDRTGRYLLEVKNKELFLVDKKEHDKVKIQSSTTQHLQRLNIENLFELRQDSYVLKNNHELAPVAVDKSLLKKLEKAGLGNFSGVYEFPGSLKAEYLVETTSDKNAYYIVEVPPRGNLLVTPILTYEQEILSKMVVGPLPKTSIKYSVEKLSEHFMVHNLLLADETFMLTYVDTSKPEYAALAGKEQHLKFFQDAYHFDAPAQHNIEQFFNHYMSAYNSYFLGVDPESAQERGEERVAFEAFVEEFLQLNSKIQQKFADAWMYKRVLELKDAKRTEITNDIVDLINYQSNIPHEKIRTIYQESNNFKDKYKIAHILQHEQHVNGPWEGDVKGDVLFEDKLTFCLLALRTYNSYSKDEQGAIQQFNLSQLEARKAFDISDALARDLANDSYSFRQGLLFNREGASDMVEAIQEREKKSAKVIDMGNVIKFKLSDDILSQDHAVYAVPRSQRGKIERATLEQDKNRLSFIMLNLQIENGLSLIANAEAQVAARTIIETNHETIRQYKEELAQRYRYIEFNKRNFNIKETIDLFISALKGERSNGAPISCVVSVDKETQRKSWRFMGARDELKIPVEAIDSKGFEVIKQVVSNYVQEHGRIMGHSLPHQEVVMEFLHNFGKNAPPTSLECAINDPSIEFLDFNSSKEPAFLQVVETKKTKPIKKLLAQDEELRMLNAHIEKMKNLAQKPALKSARKCSM